MDLRILTCGSVDRMMSAPGIAESCHFIPLQADRLNGDPGFDALFVDLDAPDADRVLEWAGKMPPHPMILLFGPESRRRLLPLMQQNEEVEAMSREDGELLPYQWRRILTRIEDRVQTRLAGGLAGAETSTLLDSLDELVFALDSTGRIQWAHRPKGNHLLLPDRAFAGGAVYDETGLPEKLVTEIRSSFDELASRGGVRAFEVSFAEGEHSRWFGCKATARLNRSGQFVGLTIVGREITELIETRTSLDHMTEDLEASFVRAFELAFTDRTTGLPNREAFLQTVQMTIEQKGSQPVSIAIIFLHNFSNIRHSTRFESGEALARAVAERLTSATTRDSYVARYSENEFAFLFPGPEAVQDTEEMIRILEEPVLIDHSNFSFNCSAGLSRYPEDATEMEGLVQGAEIALQEARENEFDHIRLFSKAHRERLEYRVKLENELARPDITDQFSIVYQPIVDARTLRTRYFELLLRWKSPQLGNIRPDLFIPLTEKNGLIIPITLWLIRQSARMIKYVPEDIRFSVNLSPVHLFAPDLIEDLTRLFNEEDVSPRRYKIEITEGVMIRDPVEATNRIVNLKQRGFSVALDDFGAGFSGLGYLGLLPVDTIKIDKSFLHEYPKDRRTSAIVGSILTLTQALGIDCIAEGVETEEQAGSLRQAGCNLFQGFLFSKPLTEQDMLAHVRDPSARPTSDAS